MSGGSGSFCAVAECNNSSRKKKKEGRYDLSFHRFPKNSAIKSEWVRACRRSDKWNPNTSFICSDHFKSSDFKRDLQAELLKYTPRQKFLLQNAIPTEKLPINIHAPKTLSGVQRLQREKSKKAKAIQQEILDSVLQCSSTDHIDPPENTENLNKPDYHLLYNEMKRKYVLLDQQYKQSCSELSAIKAELKRKNTIVRQQLFKQNARFKLRLKKEREIRKEKEMCIKKLQKNEKEISEVSIRTILSKMFTENEIKLISGQQTRVNWTSEEISKAFTLRYLSQRAYLYVRNNLKYPLPGISSLQRWAKTIEMRSGLLTDIFRILKTASQDLTEVERLTVISFDEMKVESLLEYDPLHDQVIGPHVQMQVVMARGLCAEWKQPIYIEFDQKMTKEILFQIIQQLYMVGYPVVACVSDLGGGNRALMKDLGVDYLNPSFKCPNYPKDVAYFPDTPHLIKLIRNWLLDTGFKLKDGQVVNKQPLERLLNLITGKEVTVCHKLTMHHLECQGSERQNVALAAELLSHSAATALKHYVKDLHLMEITKSTSEFINLMDKWFDIMNVYIPATTITPSFKAPFSNTEEQIALLKKCYNEIEGMRCIGKSSLQIFQKGILQSINAIKSLYESVEPLKIKYILTTKLNQDILENLFSQIRTRGGLNDHPTPLHAIHRLRMIILGKTAGIVTHGNNTTTFDKEHFLVASAFKKVQVSIDEDIMEETASSETDTASESEESENLPKNFNLYQSQTSKDGLIYLAGWLAKKFKKLYPELGDYTHILNPPADHDYSISPWIKQLSHGGLMYPSETFLNIIYSAEELLNELWGDDIPKTKGIIAKYSNIIFRQLKENINENVIKAFVRQRLFIRIKYKNLYSKNVQKTRKAKLELKRIEKLKKLI